MEKMYYKEKAAEEPLNFKIIILEIIRETAMARVRGDLIGFQNGVEILELTMTAYIDEIYTNNLNNILNVDELEKLKKIDEAKWKAKLFEIQTAKYKELMALCARSGFLPEVIIDGVIDDKNISTIINEEGTDKENT